MKKCTACKILKYEDEFYVRTARNTLRSECKECHYERNERNRANPAKTRKIQPEPTGVYKLCIKCSLELDTAFFHKCRSNPDGLHTYCKACRSETNMTVEALWISPTSLASVARPKPSAKLLP
ncbi:hypothetical protein Mbo2_112 [Rhodococcus phage Mbo2]|uniref:Uncharacterized protein n=1 Tax=Rhodococcus phage Mbo2 TaxID=2936911 RepID=A0A9E7ISH5_9CAUD|nr:hypothetical protein Mbo2_112 [Rhodococcus phage Mbo2]